MDVGGSSIRFRSDGFYADCMTGTLKPSNLHDSLVPFVRKCVVRKHQMTKRQ
jgi:hypothetical protein